MKKTATPLLILALGISAFSAREPEFDPKTVINRAFPAIVEPEAVSVEKAEAADVVKAKELVLGVVVNGEARAYPINTLTGPRREIINDELGGRSIAATW